MDYASLGLGVALGALSSWWITHEYYLRSSRDLNRDLAKLTNKLQTPRTLDDFASILKNDKWTKGFVDGTETWSADRHSTCQVVIGADSRPFDEVWSRGFADPNTCCYKVYLRIDNVTIKELLFVALDGARINVPVPDHVVVDGSIVYVWNTESIAFLVGKVTGTYYIHENIETVAKRCKIEIVRASSFNYEKSTVA